MLNALDNFNEYRIIFTKANADTDGRIINRKIDQYVKLNSGRTKVFTSLGMVRYLSALKYCELVIGNSSSGIIEAPSLGIPTVNIGNRQLGRVRAESVIDCGDSAEEIMESIRKAKRIRKEGKINRFISPYEKEGTSMKILSEIQKYLLQDRPEMKKFCDIQFNTV